MALVAWRVRTCLEYPEHHGVPSTRSEAKRARWWPHMRGPGSAKPSTTATVSLFMLRGCLD